MLRETLTPDTPAGHWTWFRDRARRTVTHKTAAAVLHSSRLSQSEPCCPGPRGNDCAPCAQGRRCGVCTKSRLGREHSQTALCLPRHQDAHTADGRPDVKARARHLPYARTQLGGKRRDHASGKSGREFAKTALAGLLGEQLPLKGSCNRATPLRSRVSSERRAFRIARVCRGKSWDRAAYH